MRKLITILIVNVVVINCLFSIDICNDVVNQYDTLNYSGQAEYNYCFTEATKQKIFGNYNQAINLFFRCIKLNPRSAAIYYQLSDIYYIMGDKKRSLSFARMAFRLEKRNVWYQLNLARIYQFNDKIDSTIYIYKRIIKSNPNKYEYQFNLAFLYVKVNKFKKSIKLLNRLEREYGFSKEIAFSLYKVYTVQNDNKNAIKILKEGIKRYPWESRFYGLLAEHYASINENELALQYYDELLNLDSDNEKGIFSLFEFYKSIGSYEHAIELAEKFICNENISKENKVEMTISLVNDLKNISNYQLVIKSLVEYLINFYNDDIELRMLYADYFVKMNNLSRAKDELVFIINSVKDNYIIWEKLFYVLSSLSDYSAIFDLSNEAISYFNEKPMLYLFKVISAYQIKQYDTALVALNTGFKYTKKSKIMELQYYTFYGEVFNALKDYKNSDFYFEKALDIDKQNIYVLNNYSFYLALRSEKLNIAEGYIKRCLEIEPKNYIYLDTYGWILYKSGKLEEAKEMLEKAVSNGGSGSSDILEHYAEILVRLNMNGEALKCYQLIKDLGRDSNKIKSLLNISD